LIHLGTVKVFQHTAARRRLRLLFSSAFGSPFVSTHSRPKAAASQQLIFNFLQKVSTHSRPKAAANLSKAHY